MKPKRPTTALDSPLDVPVVKGKLPPGELSNLIQEGRESANRFWRKTLANGRLQPTPKRRRRA